MSWKERIQSFTDQEQKKRVDIHKAIHEEWARRLAATQRVVEGLQIDDKLREIKDELWGIGQVRRDNFPNSASVRFELSTSWPTYIPAYSRQESLGYNEVGDVFHPATVESTKKAIYINVNAFLNKYGNWDEKSIVVNVNAGGNDGMPLILNAWEQITAEELEKINSLLTQACVHLSNQYPLAVLIQRDRQEIIEKVLSGKLKRSEVPVNFGYQFPPEERKAIEPKKPKKRKGLFGW